MLKFYPREDGTALDAIYLAPFNARNPDSVVLAPGESSICADTSWPADAASKSNDDDDAADGPGRAAVAVGVVLVLLVVALLAVSVFLVVAVTANRHNPTADASEPGAGVDTPTDLERVRALLAG